MSPRIQFDRLPTEQINSRSLSLDTLPTAEILRIMNKEDERIIKAVRRQQPNIEHAINVIVRQLKKSGRLFFVGAGTSGRLGVIEAAECPPTFFTKPSLVQALIAGGKQAVFQSREGAEDNGVSAKQLIRKHIRPNDAVVGITASGVTPFVATALVQASKIGAATILISCHSRSPIKADVRILLSVGAEILTGSTRLKAGTATKIVLNMLSLGVMVRLNKIYDNLMVDLKPSSVKLRKRAIQIIQKITRCSEKKASMALKASKGSTKTAVVMIVHNLDMVQATRLLNKVDGSLRKALTPNQNK